MRRKFTLIVIAIVGCVTNIYSANITISGCVKSQNGESLVGATIVDTRSNKGVVTDQNGRYSVSIPQGEVALVVSSLGYKKINQIIDANGNVAYDFEMESDDVKIDNIVVNAESQSSKARNCSYAVSAIDIKSRTGSIQNLSDVITQSLGVNIRRSGGVGADYELTLNGMDSSSINYFIDGVPLDAYGSNFTLDNISPSIVQRIEIYKGVVPAYLGGDALGGAINIITNQNVSDSYDMSYGVGSFHTHQADVAANITERRSGINIKPTFSMSYSKNDYTMRDLEYAAIEKNEETGFMEYVPIGDYKRFHDEYRSLFGQLEVGVANKKWADQFYISSSITDIDKDIQTGATQNVVYGDMTRSSLSKSLSARYLKKGFINDNIILNASFSKSWDNSIVRDTSRLMYYWDGESQKESTGGAERSSTPNISYFHRPLTMARANLDYNMGSFGAVNLNYLLTMASSESEQYRPFEEIDWYDDGKRDIMRRQYIGLSYNVDLFERWNNSIFVKEYINRVKIEEKEYGDGESSDANFDIENSEATSFFTSYGAGSRYKFMDGLAIKGSYEYSVNLPGVTQLLGNGENILPNYALNPQKSNNYNLSIYGNIKRNNSMFRYDIGGFHRDIHDYFMMSTDGSGETYQYENLAQVWISGGELELQYLYSDRLQTSVNLSYEKAVDMMKNNSDGTYNACYKQAVPNRPNLYGNASIGYAFKNIALPDDKLMLEYHYSYMHWYYLTWAVYGSSASKQIIPTQHAHNASLTYSWHDNRYSASFKCSNIFDEKLYDNYLLQKPGRSFYCKFRVFINEP